MRRTRAGDYAVDTAVRTGAGAWALVGPDGTEVASGPVAVRSAPRDDATGAEAAGIAAACAHVPEGGRLATDALSVVRSVRGRHAAHAGGRVGEAAQAAGERGIELRWARRSDPKMRKAHAAARAALARLEQEADHGR